MTPTDDLRASLRSFLDEDVPEGGTDADTRFTDMALDALLLGVDTLNRAAFSGWRLKWLRAPGEHGELDEFSVGAEKIKFVSAAEMVKFFAERMAHFQEVADLEDLTGAQLARAFEFLEPDVLGVCPTGRYVETDFSRWGG